MKVEIKNDLVEKIKENIEGTGFKDIDEYIDFVLRDILSEQEFNEEDEEKVKERLRALGYMD